jgi:hypothetical protein
MLRVNIAEAVEKTPAESSGPTTSLDSCAKLQAACLTRAGSMVFNSLSSTKTSAAAEHSASS